MIIVAVLAVLLGLGPSSSDITSGGPSAAPQVGTAVIPSPPATSDDITSGGPSGSQPPPGP